MFLIELNEATAAGRRIPVALVDDTDGKTPETGVTISAGDMKVSKNGAAEANHGGTLTELAGGDYYYEASSGEVDTLGYLTGRIVKAGIRTFRMAAQVVAVDPRGANLGLTNLDAAVSSRLATAGYTAPPTAVQNADALLGRNLAGGSDGGRTVKDALRASRNRRIIAAGTLTVYAEDDATPAWTAAVTTNAGNPISEIDPA